MDAMRDAADAIKRLTEERNGWQATAAGLSEDISNAEDEIERLNNELEDWKRTVRAYEAQMGESSSCVTDEDIERLKLVAQEACEKNHGPIIYWSANEIARLKKENRRLSLDLMVAISENAGMYDLEPQPGRLSEKEAPFLTGKPNLCPCCYEHVGSTGRNHVHPCLEAQEMLQRNLKSYGDQ